MGYKIIFAEGGQKLYDHTVNYFVDSLNSPHVALKWMAAVSEAKKRLIVGADMYKFCEDKDLDGKKLRVIHLKKYKYKIFYEIRGDTVYIKAILHDSQLPGKWI